MAPMMAPGATYAPPPPSIPGAPAPLVASMAPPYGALMPEYPLYTHTYYPNYYPYVDANGLYFGMAPMAMAPMVLPGALSGAPPGVPMMAPGAGYAPPGVMPGVVLAPHSAPLPRKRRPTTGYDMKPETAERNRCRICHKQFKRPLLLQTHYYSHTGEKIFKCPWAGCGKQFSVKLNMTRHYRLHEREHQKPDPF